ncbi:MAG: SDH family Clp fold serine proteinase [Deltaproteobacteria bacterium]|jgi:hypothetical protein
MIPGRRALYDQIEKTRGSRVISYITGDRPGLEIQIHPEIVDHFVHHLDLIGVTPKISLVLHTRGGNTLAAWSLVNLIRQFCDDFEVIVPAKAQSAGTLIAMGANAIVMTKQATLGPIDPSITGPLNPTLATPGGPQRVPVSVEAINGFLEFAKEGLGTGAAHHELGALMGELTRQVHPLVLGSAFRARAQIRMLGRRLLQRHMTDNATIDKLLAFLCSESGSHDYTIFRREARDELGLNIIKPTVDEYLVLKALYDQVSAELQLGDPYDPNVLLNRHVPDPNAPGSPPTAPTLPPGMQLPPAMLAALAASTGPNVPYTHRRGLLESVPGGTHVFVSEGVLQRQKLPHPSGVLQDAILDTKNFEGWRHEK